MENNDVAKPSIIGGRYTHRYVTGASDERTSRTKAVATA